jgi:fatty-acyl-CoA synthase
VTLTHARMLRAAAASYGNRIALSSFDRPSVTYRELAERSWAIAGGLRAADATGPGLVPGDRVVWLSYNRDEYLPAYYGTAIAGLAWAPLNYWLRAHELRPILELLAPRAAFVEPAQMEVFEQAADGLDLRLFLLGGEPCPDASRPHVPWEDLVTSPAFTGAESAEDALHEVVFTSGTTGQAKGVMRSQRKRIIDSFAAALTFRLNGDDHMLRSGPQFHIGGGSVPGQLLIQGGEVTSSGRFDPEQVARNLACGVTYMMGVPAHYNMLFESGFLDGMDLRHVRGVYTGGSVATVTLFERMQATFPNAEICHGYGSTESGPHSIGIRGRGFLERPGTLGLPVAGVEVQVIGEDGEPVGVDEVGELVLRSPAVMDGYYANPALTATVLDADGWYRTGDLVRRDADGYFFIADRKKDMIISGGENVYSREVEDVLSNHPAVEEVAVIGTPDPIYEERVTAIVHLRAGMTASVDELVAHARQRLAGYKCPRRVEFVDAMPLNPVGKIDKVELRDRFGGSVFG